MFNLKTLFLSIFLIATSAILLETQEVKAQNNTCTFTYQQGYSVGANIARSEEFYNQNLQMYKNTLRDFSHCSLYVAGVTEGFNRNRKSFSNVGGPGDPTYYCGGSGAVCPPGAGDPDQ